MSAKSLLKTKNFLLVVVILGFAFFGHKHFESSPLTTEHAFAQETPICTRATFAYQIQQLGYCTLQDGTQGHYGMTYACTNGYQGTISHQNCTSGIALYNEAVAFCEYTQQICVTPPPTNTPIPTAPPIPSPTSTTTPSSPPTATPTCTIRPSCLDLPTPCDIVELESYCPATPTPTKVPLTCDPEEDGVIDRSDFDKWLAEYRDTSGNGTKTSDCFKPDGKVDLLDFQVWRDIAVTQQREAF